MPRYVDGFLLVVSKKRLPEYRDIARKAARVWKEHGAIDYVECVGDDLNVKFGLPFPKLTKLKAGEVVVFSWIIYKSRAHRNAVNKKVMKDPRLQAMMAPEAMPFDGKRMSMGGFSVLVDA
jgi:uncharacterized protein YbaA (DUF1428 family)